MTPSKKTTQTDNALAERVGAAFMKDERLSAQPVHVAVQDGVIVLAGTVQTYRRKLAAHEISASFEGCRDVVNELAVEPVVGIMDDEIGDNVRAALHVHADITKAAIAVSVAAGEATLAGHVGSHWERVIAEDVARSARGVRDVTNLLVVDTVEKVEAKQLSQDIAEALAQTSGLKDADVHIAVTDNAVVLSGEVARLWHKAAAEAVVRRLWHRQIRNDIAVTGY